MPKTMAFGQPFSTLKPFSSSWPIWRWPSRLARNQYLKAAWLKDQGRNHTLEATVAKFCIGDGREVASDALHIHSGYGYMNEYPVSRYYRGANFFKLWKDVRVQRAVSAAFFGERVRKA
jgi:alkylation response protein AidB-like acyl-CoA dehydrogenase